MKISKSLYEDARWSTFVLVATILSFATAMVITLVALERSKSQTALSQKIKDLVSDSQLALVKAESSQRGYLFTGKETYLVDLGRTRSSISTSLREAMELSQKPNQERRLGELDTLAGQKISSLSKTIELISQGDPEAVKELALSGEGKLIMESFDELTSNVLEAEDRYVTESQTAVKYYIYFIQILLAAGSIGSALLSIAWLRSVKERLAPLQRCVRRAEEIAQNKFSGEPLPVTSEDEVGRLTKAVNVMTEALRREAHSVESARLKVHDTAFELSRGSVEQSAALTQLAASIQEIGSTVQELNMSANQMSDNAQGLVDESATRQRASERGLKAVEESQDSARIVREQVESVARVTVTLNEKAAKVERIVFFVNELTERSNILSINAALLAATSEKGGESFAVLADEMQKLTSRSKESTLEIHDMLQSIRAEIQRVVLAAEEATKQVETGEKFAGQASKSIKSLKQAVDEGNNHFLQVVAAVRQQNQALSQVEQALVAMRDSAQLVEEGGRKIENSSTDLAKLSNKLGDTALLKAVRES